MSTGKAAPAKRVLVLNSYHQGYEWTDDIVSGIRATLRQSDPETEIHVEYMDLRRHREEDRFYDLLAAFYAQKYTGIPIDAIIATDDAAVRFLVRRRTGLFPGTPVVFCGVNEYQNQRASRYVHEPSVRQFASGVLETIDVADTARTALQLHPGTKFIYLIGDAEAHNYDRELSRAHPGVTVRRILTERLSIEEIEAQLAKLPQASVVLLSAFSRDATNRQFSMAESTRRVASSSVAPVYGFNKNSLGGGIVGGKLTDGISQGREVARLALRVLQGTPPSEIPITAESTNPYMFDHAQLQRWGIRPSSLPTGSIVVGRPRSLYAQYKAYIWGFAVFMIGQAIAIGLLVASRLRLKRIQQALRETEQDLRRQINDFETLLKVLPVAIGVAEDRECRTIRTNPAFAELLGVSSDENSSKTRSDPEPLPFKVYRDGEEISGEDLPMQVAAREGREVRGIELDVVRADGRTIHEYGYATPLLDDNGQVRGSLGVFIDMTERKRAEEALRESESRFRQLADSMPQIVWTARPDGQLDYYNLRWYEFTGLSEGEDGERDWSRVLHPDDLNRYLETWHACVQSGDSYEFEYRFWHVSSRRYRWQLGRAVAVRDASRSVVKWIGTCTDIDDHKRTEQALRRANEDLEQFAYSASHDLQEPLRSVRIYSQLVSRRYASHLDDNAERFFGYIVEGAHRMELLLKGLLAYTNISAVLGEPAEPVNPNSVLDDLLNELKGPIESSGARISIDPDLPPLRMHRNHLQQLLRNLLTNALIYHNTEAPRISIEAERHRTHHIFSVRDNGIGINPEYAQQIFRIFKRLHTRDRYQGAGIGLAICQKIIDHYGGRIWVESKEGDGATFRFTIPAQQGAHHD